MSLRWAAAGGLQSSAAGVEWVSVTGTIAMETTLVRTSGQAYRFAPGASKILSHNAYASAQGVHYYRGYFHLVTAPAGDINIFYLSNSSNNKVGVKMTSGRLLQLYNLEDIAQVGSNSAAVSTGAYYRLELKVDDTTLASTVIEARLYAASDEATQLWNPSGTINITATPNRFFLANGNDANLDIVWTDVGIVEVDGTAPDTWMGEGSIGYSFPNGAGANAQWTRGGTDSGANWSQVDEKPPNGVTDYNQSNTANQIDDFAVTNTPAAVGSSDIINWVAAGCNFAISSATGADPDFCTRITAGGNTDESANLSGAGTTAYTSYQVSPVQVFGHVLTDMPGASTTGWTKTDLDSAELGVKETVTDTHFVRVTALWLMYDHKPAPAGGTEYTQSVSGAITPAGAMSKQTNRSLGGATTPDGGLFKQLSRALSGATTPDGALLKQLSRSLSGTISPSGILAAAKVVLKSLSGAITPAGSLSKQTNRSLSGAITPAGTLTKQLRRALSGAVSSTGLLTASKVVVKILVGAITPAGSLSKQTNRSLSGAAAPAGAITRISQRLLAGTITPAGAMGKQARKSLAGTVTWAGQLTKQARKSLAGTVTWAGQLTKQARKALSGIVSALGALVGILQPGGPGTEALLDLGCTITEVVTPIATLTPANPIGTIASQARPMAELEDA